MLCADNEAGSTEDPEIFSPPGLFAQAHFVFGCLGLLNELCTPLSERVEYRANLRRVPDLAILGKVGLEDYPRERDAVLGAESLHVSPHVTPLRRIDVEGRVVPALLRENGTQEERLPEYR